MSTHHNEPYPTSLDGLAEALHAQLTDVPRSVPIISLKPPEPKAVQARVKEFAARAAAVTGHKPVREQLLSPTKVVAKNEDGLRVVGFLASGAISITSGLDPFVSIFQRDPGTEDLTALTKSALDRLGLFSLVPDGHALDFERLWRIRAAGGDAKGVLTNPVLCRAVGAYRHSIDGIAVLGRASMTAEVAGDASLTRASMSMRHVSGDGGGERIGEVAVSGGGDAATSVVTQLTRAFGKGKTGDVRFTAEAFEFGYLSLGRRRQQSALAPFYVARISVDHGPEAEATAHVFAVPASKERFVRLPSARRPAATMRAAS